MNPSSPRPISHLLVGALVWILAWTLLATLDGRLGLANLALLLVMAAAVAAPWWPAWLSLLLGAASVLAFNWLFVPPRGSFLVEGSQDLWLLGGMLVVSWITAGLTAALQRQLAAARGAAAQVEQLRRWGDALRDAEQPGTLVSELQQMLAALGHGPATLWLCPQRPLARVAPADASAEEAGLLRLGEADAEEAAGLLHCLRQGQAMGPGTGRHQQLPQWFLPLRGRSQVLGAALLRGEPVRRGDEAVRRQAQALCDQLGQALERRLAREDEAAARLQAQAQGVRNALLAAVSHDYRTPLATILGAAGSLIDQAAQLSPEQRLRLAGTIRDQATQLSRMTDNTLQLARLDAPGVQLRLDWESPEEIVGAAMHRAHQREREGQLAARAGSSRLRARVEPGLPLLRCDAVLLAQLLDNLVDNALAYSPAEAPVELLARRQGERLLLAVRDRGPGVPSAWRQAVFEAYHRGPEAGRHAGSGVGLAVCQAIAQAHGGEMRLRPRGHGGSAFECWLPLQAAPAGPAPETDSLSER